MTLSIAGRMASGIAPRLLRRQSPTLLLRSMLSPWQGFRAYRVSCVTLGTPTNAPRNVESAVELSKPAQPTRLSPHLTIPWLKALAIKAQEGQRDDALKPSPEHEAAPRPGLIARRMKDSYSSYVCFDYSLLFDTGNDLQPSSP